MLDLLITNGVLFDPEKKLRFRANLGLKDGRIACYSADALPTHATLDAGGCYVCPGFIDPHGHLDGNAYAGELSIRQGITTTIGGNCGFSPACIESFFRAQDEHGYIINQAEMIGHSGTLRTLVGLGNVHATACTQQTGTMLELCEKAFDAGACGLSLGLGYAPGTSLDEVLPLCKLAASRGRIVSVDTRMYTKTDLYSLVEAIDIARRSEVRLQISHFVYQYGVGVEEEALELIDCARRSGVDVYLDSGMYTDWATGISTALFEPEIMRDNDIELWHVRMATGEHRGQVLDQALYDHVRSEHLGDSAIVFTGDEEAIYTILRHPLAMPSTDAGAYLPGEGHPQIAGSFPRFFKKMVCERRELSWEEAIYRATALPAEVFSLKDRGVLRIGAHADIVIFDPTKICDHANFVGLGLPDAAPDGINSVIIGGVIALNNGCVLTQRAGQSLRF